MITMTMTQQVSGDAVFFDKTGRAIITGIEFVVDPPNILNLVQTNNTFTMVPISLGNVILSAVCGGVTVTESFQVVDSPPVRGEIHVNTPTEQE